MTRTSAPTSVRHKPGRAAQGGAMSQQHRHSPMIQPGTTARAPARRDPATMGNMPNSPLPGAHDQENGPPPPP